MCRSRPVRTGFGVSRPRASGRAYGYLSGFDPAYAFESPGTILLDHAIREAAREGCSEFNFLRGQEPYKYAWRAKDRWTSKRIIAPASLRHSE